MFREHVTDQSLINDSHHITSAFVIAMFALTRSLNGIRIPQNTDHYSGFYLPTPQDIDLKSIGQVL